MRLRSHCNADKPWSKSTQIPLEHNINSIKITFCQVLTKVFIKETKNN